MRNGLGLVLLLCTGLVSAVSAQGLTRFDGQYVGELTLTRTIGGDCTRPPPGALYPLTISGGRVQFKYDPRFDTILVGSVDQAGRFTATRRLRQGLISMTGRISGRNLNARIVSPSCNYTFKTRN